MAIEGKKPGTTKSNIKLPTRVPKGGGIKKGGTQPGSKHGYGFGKKK